MQNKLILLLLIFLSLFFSLYAKPITERIDSNIPENWILKSDTFFLEQQPIEQKWWQSFDDPVLNSIEELAIANNYDLVAASYRIAQAKANMRIAEAGFYPQISLGAAYDYNKNISAIGMIAHTGSLGLDFQWEIDIIGSVRNKANAQKKVYEATQEEYNAMMTILVAQVANAYFSLRTTQLRLNVVKRNLATQKETMNITEARFNSGLVSALDVSQAKSIYYSTAASKPQLESLVSKYINTIGVLVGKLPWDLESDLALVKDIPLRENPILVPVGIPSEVIRQRPDVRSTEKQIDAQAAQLGATRADWWPKFYLTAKFGYASTDFQQLFMNNNMYWQVAPAIQWTIFSGTQFSGSTQAAKANLEISINNYNNTILSALQDVDDAMKTYRYSVNESEMRRKAFKEALTTFSLALDLYKRGLINFQNVLDAQRSLLQYEDAIVSVEGNTYSALVNLFKALGGGWNNK